MLNNQEFFDKLSVQYDSMIPIEEAIKRKEELFQNLLKNSPKTIADIGCGTGSDSLALSGLGHKVTSFDPSAQMLNKARLNAKGRGLDLDFYLFGASQIPDEFNGKYDDVISLGNSFANIPADEFESSVYKCFSLLKEKGELYIQILNYKKILKEKKRIVSITIGKNKYFVRFYDFIKNQVVFNILQFDKTNPADHQLLSTKIYPYSVDDFTPVLNKAGFKTINYYGSITITQYNPKKSNDLIIKAIK
jgi:ubiquinone/menaquinone biosynthesis C-methylase UbiE